MILANVMTGVSSGGVVFLVVSALLPEKLPVNITNVTVSPAGVVTYERVVNSDEVIRAAWWADVIENETELSVPGCEGSGWADYGPEEPQEQTWPIDLFTAPGCMAALDPEREYSTIATVTPLVGPGDAFRSPPFRVNP